MKNIAKQKTAPKGCESKLFLPSIWRRWQEEKNDKDEIC